LLIAASSAAHSFGMGPANGFSVDAGGGGGGSGALDADAVSALATEDALGASLPQWLLDDAGALVLAGGAGAGSRGPPHRVRARGAKARRARSAREDACAVRRVCGAMDAR